MNVIESPADEAAQEAAVPPVAIALATVADDIAYDEPYAPPRVSSLPPRRSKPAKPRTSFLVILGLIIATIGLFLLFRGLTTSVSLPGQSTVNFDMMQMRQNYIIMGCFLWLIGTINMATGAVLRKMPSTT